MIKVHIINPRAQTITTSEIANVFPAAKDIIGGWLTVAFVFPNGDTLYVDDEGLLKDPRSFFKLPDEMSRQPFAGIGVLTGPETETEAHGLEEPGIITLDVQTSAEELTPLISWLDRDGFAAWARANSRRTAASVTALGENGAVEVHKTTWGEIVKHLKEKGE